MQFDLFVISSPFILSFLLQAFSPITSKFTREMILSQGEARNAPVAIKEAAVDWSSHAFNTIQMVTTYIISIGTGGLVLYNRGIGMKWILLLTFVGAIGLYLSYEKDAAKWMTQRYWIYTPAAILGMLLNIAILLGIGYSSPFLP